MGGFFYLYVLVFLYLILSLLVLKSRKVNLYLLCKSNVVNFLTFIVQNKVLERLVHVMYHINN